MHFQSWHAWEGWFLDDRLLVFAVLHNPPHSMGIFLATYTLMLDSFSKRQGNCFISPIISEYSQMNHPYRVIKHATYNILLTLYWLGLQYGPSWITTLIIARVRVNRHAIC
jgi:hypothetical protein